MKWLYLIALFFTLSNQLNAQSVSVSPYSFKFWGGASGMSEISVEHKGFGLHYFHSFQDRSQFENNGQFVKDVSVLQSTPALSFSPITIKDIFKPGIMVSYNQFPVKKGSRLNFILDLGYSFNQFRISYVHISNGFGLINEYNIGMDTIRLSYSLR